MIDPCHDEECGKQDESNFSEHDQIREKVIFAAAIPNHRPARRRSPPISVRATMRVNHSPGKTSRMEFKAFRIIR